MKRIFWTTLFFILLVFAVIGQAQATEYNFTYEAPTTNEDGSPLTDLDGYNIYEDGVKVKDMGNVTSYTYNVPEGSHTYTVRAYDTSGNESKDSDLLIMDITVCPEPVTNFKATKVE